MKLRGKRAANGRASVLRESLQACEQRVEAMQQAEEALIQDAEDARNNVQALRLKLEEVECAERALARTLAEAQEKMRNREAAHDGVVSDLQRQVQDLQRSARAAQLSTNSPAQSKNRGDDLPWERVKKLEDDLALCRRRLAHAEDLKSKAEDRVRSLQESADTEMRKVGRVHACLLACLVGEHEIPFASMATLEEFLQCLCLLLA